jgi:hypothetical protein
MSIFDKVRLALHAADVRRHEWSIVLRNKM